MLEHRLYFNWLSKPHCLIVFQLAWLSQTDSNFIDNFVLIIYHIAHNFVLVIYHIVMNGVFGMVVIFRAFTHFTQIKVISVCKYPSPQYMRISVNHPPGPHYAGHILANTRHVHTHSWDLCIRWCLGYGA